jgi:hypothetical protein
LKVNTDGYDRIYVDTESLVNFQKWFNVDDVKKNFVHPMKKCVLVMDKDTDYVTYLFVERVEGKTIFESGNSDYGLLLKWERDDGLPFIPRFITQIPNRDKYIELIAVTHAMETFYYNTMYFMSLKPEEVETDKVRVQKVKKNKGKSNKKSVTYVTNKIFKVNMKKEYTEEEKREYKRLAEAWTVRGHWRTYKNGKKVWVSGYRKGKGELTDKEYKIKTK